jgi:hypothetical protein
MSKMPLFLQRQKSKSTFKTKMRFAEMFQSVSYATQLIWRLRRVSRYLSQILHVEVLLLRITVRSKFATHTFIRETTLSHAQNHFQLAILVCILHSIHPFPAHGCLWSAYEVRLLVRVFFFLGARKEIEEELRATQSGVFTEKPVLAA